MKNNVYNLTLKDWEEYFINKNDKKFKGQQVFDWLYRKRVASFDDMTNIKKEVIDMLKNDFDIKTVSITKVERDVDVNKYLFKLKDDEKVEAVLMNHLYGNSLCISTQVGCNMGCKFCESGRLKKVRNLETHEMIEQILLVEEECGKRISHVVVMGIGEPFDNYDNLVKFIEIINNPKGLELGSRHITVSTCGVVPKIKEFMKLPYQVNLAISLHAPNNEIRNTIMPINKAYPIEVLMATLNEYIKETNRRVTFEYILLDGVNDTAECAQELANLVKGMNCYINLIPYNETNNISYKRTKSLNISKFYDILKKNRINVTIRREYGSNISAACGQLRSKKED
ncbi:MAG: 23S rRNA (adenine(2503)-C(2))-methyltransferase RlmN [Tenericutes bacterium]|nr:23S rRNA (adenine(2503)-C(2))-methyltransferase RlmN [Mycoplasmatota bacterium]